MLKWFLKLFFSLALLIFVLARIDWTNLVSSLDQIKLSYFLIACFVLFLIHFLPALAQQILFLGVGLNFKLSKIYLINLRSMFYSLALPGDFAGGIARYVQFSKTQFATESKLIRSDILTVMLLDRVLNMVGLLILVNVFQLFSYARGYHLPVQGFLDKIIIVVDFFSLVTVLLFYYLPWGSFFSIVPQRISKIKIFIQEIVELIQKIHFFRVFLALFFLVVFQVMAFLFFDVILAKSIPLVLPWFYFAVIVFSSRFLKFLPLTYAGIGVSENLYPLFLQQQGVSVEQATLLALLSTTAALTLSVLGGFFTLLRFGWEKND